MKEFKKIKNIELAGICLLLFCFIANMGCDVDPLPTKGNGTYRVPNGELIIVDGDKRLLKLKGTKKEIGYSHGYLLAAEIINFINTYVFWALENKSKYTYDEIVSVLSKRINWGDDAVAELTGMLEGIKDALPANKRRLLIPGKQRSKEITLFDLLLTQTCPEWVLGCSAFSTWGEGRSKKNGEVLHARNMDWICDPEENLKKYQVIMAINPDNEQKFVSISFVGMIGCASCMNESGVTITTHATHYLMTTDQYEVNPYTAITREVIKKIDGNDSPADVESLLDTTKTYIGINLHTSFSSSGRGNNDDISAIIEYDGKANHPDGRATLRKPSFNPGLPVINNYDAHLDYEDSLILTNHYLERSEKFAYADSFNRYDTIKNMLENKKADGHVSTSEALAIMAAVGRDYTIQTMLFFPDTLELEVYLARAHEGGAFNQAPLKYNFSNLFLK